MHINDRRMRYLHEAVKCGSMRAAAEALDMAPSSISRQIAQLEAEIGAELIEHGRRDIRLTEAGQRVIAYFKDQISSQEALKSYLQDISGVRAGHIQVALGEGFLGDALYDTLDEFQSLYPGLTLTVRVTDTTDILRLIAEDEVHFAIAFNPPSDLAITSRFRSAVPLKAIMHPEHPLAHNQTVTIADLAQYPIALMDQRFRIRQFFDHASSDAHISLRPVVTSNSIAILTRSARSGKALTILPEISVRSEIETGHLVAVPLQSPQLQLPYVHLITRANRTLSPVVTLLMQRLRSLLSPQASKGVTSLGSERGKQA
jgi:DNA-binding transcriptional LysR family regulator